MSAAQGGSYRQDILAMRARPERRFALPLLILSACVSALLILMALGDWTIASGFAAAIIGLAGIAYAVRPGEQTVVATREVPPDWSVIRAAANTGGLAMAVTDRSGRLVCASDLYGEWFSGWPAPSALTLD